MFSQTVSPKYLLGYFVATLVCTGLVCTDDTAQLAAVGQLLLRVIPAHRHQFVLRLTNTSTVSVRNGHGAHLIEVDADSGVNLAFGIQAYLRKCCNVHFSWDGFQLNLPASLPPLKESIVLQPIGKYRYFGNICTFSYSMVWWRWKEWSRFIDWLALNGFNLLLAPVGQEAVWYDVWKRFGLSDADLREHFSGPAFLAWNRMGNLRGWGGPLSSEWRSQQKQLQRRILKRVTAFGMTPVLPAFAGHVPTALRRRFILANFTQLSCWGGFGQNYSCMDFLQPTDPLFFKVATELLKETRRVYGVHHVYSADPFNEMSPPSFEHDYLRGVVRAIYRPMAAVDPHAVWLLQGWMFVNDDAWRRQGNARAFLTALPGGRLLVLDLWSEARPLYAEFDSYFGQPYIWNMLHNFGGVSEMRGSIGSVNKGLSAAVAEANSSLVGTGLTMEGIYQNYVMYQFLIDRSWSAGAINTSAWIGDYAIQRYGADDRQMQIAWQSLLDTIYSEPVTWTALIDVVVKDSALKHSTGKSLIFLRPHLHRDSTVWYKRRDVCRIWTTFVNRAAHHDHSNLFRQDLVAVTREILQLIASQTYYVNVQLAYYNKNAHRLQQAVENLTEILMDMDALLKTHEHYLLGKWVASAYNKSDGDDEAALFELNERNQVTLWGPTGEIVDYARKEWADLLADYYAPRWRLFGDDLLAALRDRRAFSQRRFDARVLQLVEQPFTRRRGRLTWAPTGDAAEAARRLHRKYYAQCMSEQ